MSSAVILGHSFVKSCQKYVVQSKSSMFNLKQYSHVYFHGIGGATITTMEKEIEIIGHLDARCVIIDVGSNDLCDNKQDVLFLAKSLLKLAREVVGKYGVTVVLMPQFNRKNGTFPYNQHDFNVRLREFNMQLKKLCKEQPNPRIMFHNLRNMWPLWESLICKDGVHLTEDGMRRLCRNYRAALVRVFPL